MLGILGLAGARYGTEGREFESLRARHRKSCTRGLFVCLGRPRSFAGGVRVKPRVKIPHPRACRSRFTVVADLVDVEWTGCTPRSPSETPGLTCVRRSLLAAVLPSPRDAHRAELQRLGGASATGHVVSDRALWLDEWCPTCRVAPGSRCRTSYLSRTRSQTKLHVARGWRAGPCPKCKALSGEPCRTPSGREASHAHTARLRPGRHELISGEPVWQELERRSAAIAVVPLSGRAGRGGHTDRIVFSRIDGDQLVDIERWTGRDDRAGAGGRVRRAALPPVCSARPGLRGRGRR